MLLEAIDVKKTYSRGNQPVHALRGVSMNLSAGEFTAIMGPSGSGKSTLLHLVGGLDRPSSGSVRFDSKPIETLTDEQLSAFRRRRLGFIFQFFNLLPSLTAIENVALPLLLDGRPMSEIRPKAHELLAFMGLDRRMDHRPNELSGGEMQRVAIARALVSEPYLILADEPTGNLDSKTGELILTLLKRLASERDQAILMVTHDRKAASYANRLITLRDGLIETDTETGATAAVNVSSEAESPIRSRSHWEGYA